ncbi:hypothetical protein [Kitasatospora sp. NPDC056181]|uniref:hypothetical protein n=1 Tax=Kitasatospora sp. NPDC056181 TaxID=3345737 RepID=UPI0035DB4E8D
MVPPVVPGPLAAPWTQARRSTPRRASDALTAGLRTRREAPRAAPLGPPRRDARAVTDPDRRHLLIDATPAIRSTSHMTSNQHDTKPKPRPRTTKSTTQINTTTTTTSLTTTITNDQIQQKHQGIFDT